MPLKADEINKLIDKLRKRYAEYGDKHSKKWFDAGIFEDRLAHAIKNRMNLEGFILAEIKNFEEIKLRYDKKRGNRKFSERVDKIIEEHTARIKKYPAHQFHPAAGMEIAHFYGALVDFNQHYFSVLRMIINEPEHKDRIFNFEQRLALIAAPGKTLPKRLDQHVLILARPGVRELDVERDKNAFLKETAFLLHEIMDCCDLLVGLRIPGWEQPLQFAKLHIESGAKKTAIGLFKECTSYGAVLLVKKQAQNIIEDFRLTAFRKKDNA